MIYTLYIHRNTYVCVYVYTYMYVHICIYRYICIVCIYVYVQTNFLYPQFVYVKISR